MIDCNGNWKTRILEKIDFFKRLCFLPFFTKQAHQKSVLDSQRKVKMIGYVKAACPKATFRVQKMQILIFLTRFVKIE